MSGETCEIIKYSYFKTQVSGTYLDIDMSRSRAVERV